jgi:predicted RNA-binding Zn-ribbon protein involved in translation (DUF1610 family)
MLEQKRSSQDEFIRLLDYCRSAGFPVDEYVPLDCPNCGAFFQMREQAYREWRDEEGKTLPCPNCLAFFTSDEAPFGRVSCRHCGRLSGYLPASMCKAYEEKSPGWQCSQCGRDEAINKLEESLHREKQGTGSSGCLLLLATFAGLSLLLLFA